MFFAAVHSFVEDNSKIKFRHTASAAATVMQVAGREGVAESARQARAHGLTMMEYTASPPSPVRPRPRRSKLIKWNDDAWRM